jgi:hypothetical protein
MSFDDKIEDIIEAGRLLIEFRFMNYEYEVLKMELNFIGKNPFLSLNEKSEKLEEIYLESKSVL